MKFGNQKIACTCMDKELPETQVPADLLALLRHIRSFWQDGASGWAPTEARESLQRIDFDNLVDLAEEFSQWYAGENQSRGQLVLAWVALGAVSEGSLQWFLSVYKDGYLRDPLFKGKNGDTVIPPEDVFFFKLIRYFERHVWTVESTGHELAGKRVFVPMLHTIRLRRNAIHSRSSDLGNWHEWRDYLHGVLLLVAELEGRVPYPDEYYAYPADADNARGRHFLSGAGQ